MSDDQKQLDEGLRDEDDSDLDGVGPLNYEDIEVKGVDQQKAKGAWDKMQASTTFDVFLTGAKHGFQCIKGFVSYIKEEHFSIGVFPKGLDPNNPRSRSKALVDMALIRGKDGTFKVISTIEESDGETPLTGGEVNSLLAQLAESVKKNPAGTDVDREAQKTGEDIKASIE